MKFNTDVNVLGGLPDWELITYFYNKTNYHFSTFIKTEKSIKRFKKAILNTLLTFKSLKLESLFKTLLINEGISKNLLLFLFWNASLNNELFRYLNENVYFPALYSGRYSLKSDEVVACLMDLKDREQELRNWAESTIKTIGSKYLTLLKKFGLLDGKNTKIINQPFINNKMFVIFVYWLIEVNQGGNMINSAWLKYGFTEQALFIERIRKKQYVKYFNIYFTGDKLQIEPLIEYGKIYENIAGN